MERYDKFKILNNSSDYYAPLRKSRNLKNIKHYETIIIKNPTLSERVRLKTDTHIWKYGDRFYKLAHKYYGEPQFWWVVAWYNGFPTEADVRPGDALEIPLNLEQAIKVLGV
jgi:hypothetical protein